MADHDRVRRMTDSLAGRFPERKNELEKEKYYYDHNYCTFSDWEKAVEKIIDSVN